MSGSLLAVAAAAAIVVAIVVAAVASRKLLRRRPRHSRYCRRRRCVSCPRCRRVPACARVLWQGCARARAQISDSTFPRCREPRILSEWRASGDDRCRARSALTRARYPCAHANLPLAAAAVAAAAAAAAAAAVAAAAIAAAVTAATAVNAAVAFAVDYCRGERTRDRLPSARTRDTHGNASGNCRLELCNKLRKCAFYPFFASKQHRLQTICKPTIFQFTPNL